MDKGPQFTGPEPTEIAPGYTTHQKFGDDVRWMSLDAVKRHREYDRSKPLHESPGQGHSYSPEEWAKNVQDVKENGIKSPLIMQYDRGTHRAIVGEGNHRLVWAEQAGHKAVPVRVNVSKTPGFLNDRTSDRHAVRGEQKVAREGYVPGDHKPGQVFDRDHYEGNPKAGRELIVRDSKGNIVK